MKKSKVFVFILTIMILTVGTVSAAYYTYYSSWTSAEGSYAPYQGSVRSDSYSRTGADDVEIHVYYVKYSSSAVARIQELALSALHLFPGLDVTDMSGNLTYDGWYSTNYPNPKFDTDDDEPNGSSEETEITCQSPTLINTTTNYYFNVGFKEYGYAGSSYSGTINITAHESYPQLTEYQTYYFDTLDTIPYLTPAS